MTFQNPIHRGDAEGAEKAQRKRREIPQES